MSIHPLANVDSGAELGDGVVIGPFAVVEGKTVIGEGTEIRAHAVVKSHTRIREECVVHEHAILGGEPQDLSFQGGISHTEIGARTRIREGVTVHRGTQAGSYTCVGTDCFLMAYSHIAHECRLGDRVILANNVALGGHVEVGERAFLSGGVVVHQFCRVGRMAMVGGNGKVVQDCLPFVTFDGVPVRAAGLNVVGLRRGGVSAAGLRALKEAYRLLLRSNLPLASALERMRGIEEPLVAEMIEFVRGSKRGFTRERRGPASE